MTLPWVLAALSRLKAISVLHPNHLQAQRDLTAALLAVVPGEIIEIVGPPRVGKTYLIEDTLRVKIGQPPDEKMRQPVLAVDAGNEGPGGAFTTKAFYAGALAVQEHPVYGHMVRDLRDGDYADYRYTAEPLLQAAFRKSLRTLHTQQVVVDEAHHIGYAPGGLIAAAKILDAFKSLVNRSNATLILSGSYELLRLTALSAHFSGRVHVVEVPRYSENAGDIEAFVAVLVALSEGVEFAPDTTLVNWSPQLFAGCLGRVPALIKWFRFALAHVISRRLTTLTWEAFESTRTPAQNFAAIGKEIHDGERMLGRYRARINGDAPPPPSRERTQRRQAARNGQTPYTRKARRSPTGGRA